MAGAADVGRALCCTRRTSQADHRTAPRRAFGHGRGGRGTGGHGARSPVPRRWRAGWRPSLASREGLRKLAQAAERLPGGRGRPAREAVGRGASARSSWTASLE